MARLLCLYGPTASGKSQLALALAERLDAVIVNADAQQVYADLRVLSARPTLEEEARAPHHLYGHVDLAETYSVGRWLDDVTRVLAGARAAGRRAILAGGAGLYFSALTKGLAEIPDIPQAVAEELRAELARGGTQALHALLAQEDPAMAARLQPGDGVRVLRALAVRRATGRSIAAFQAETRPLLGSDEWCGLILAPPRQALYAAIDARFAAMVAGGALEEARRVAGRGLDPLLPGMKAHGLPALLAHLRGEASLPEAMMIGARDTRRYAKRQFTWAGGQFADWARITAPDLAARMAHVLAVWRPA